VVFQSGDIELQGTLMLPDSIGAVRAIVFLHGSGPATREGARPYAKEFAELGIASLFFDKPGTGSSGGSWVTASLDDLAGDAVAAVEYLRTVPEVDAERIGFWGVSQAGWVAPVAATRSSDVAFMILVSGGGASPRESEMFSYQRAFDRAGLSTAETRQATDIPESYFRYLETGEGRASILERLDEIRDGRLGQLASELTQVLPSEENRPNWSWVATHDPTSFIEVTRIPILLMYGGRDADHPTDLAVERWREGLSNGGNNNNTIMVFPDATHGIRVGHHDLEAPFADGYWEVQLGWLWLHVLNAN